MNKIKTNQIWNIAGVRIIIGEVLPSSVKVFSTYSGKMEIWTYGDILICGNLL